MRRLLVSRYVVSGLFAIALLPFTTGQGCAGPSPQANQAPTANAGPDQTVSTNAAVALSGSGTDPDGDTLTFAWSQIPGTTVTLTNANTASASFTAPSTAGVLTFQLAVNDGHGGTTTDTVNVTVTAANRAPTASAGLDQTVSSGAPVTLSGSGTDPDGDTLTFAWSQTPGATVTLTNANTATASFTAPSTAGVLTFQLAVNDGHGGTATDTVNVTVAVTPQLFISNFTASGVLSYLNPSTINGNIAPSTNLSGPQTGLVNPADIVVTSSDVLLSVNLGAAPASITVHTNASTANGNVVPTRNVSGANTGLLSPVTLAINPADDLLFVANNAGTFDINVYAHASTPAFLGNLPPTRTIKSTALNHPFGINFGANDELYVANNADNKILVFANASNLNGPGLTPSRTLTNAAFAGLFDCYIDAEDRLYVVNGAAGGNKIHVINNASTKNGPVIIDSTLTVTGAVSLTAIAVDKNQTGYLVDNGAVGGGAILVYDAINTKNGAFTPNRTIAGANTQLSGPIRVFLVE